MDEGLSWFARAECRGMETSIWFPPFADYSQAQEVCDRCSVGEPCLEFALRQTVDGYGMFGGCTPGERDAIRWKRMMG